MATRESVTEAILAAATENSELLNKLAVTSEAPSIYRSHLVHVQRLREALEEQTGVLDSLKSSSEAQFKAHKKLRDSNVRRLYYRATRMLAKFEQKAMSEERQYFDALKKQSKAEERQLELQQDLKRAETEEKSAEAAANEHGRAHERLDELYDNLYVGPTPGFEYEDTQENAFYVSRRKNDSTKADILAARRATRLLEQATKNVKSAKSYLASASQESMETLFILDTAVSLTRLSSTYTNYALSAAQKAADLLKLAEFTALLRTLTRTFRLAQVDSNGSYTRATLTSTIEHAQGQLDAASIQLKAMMRQVKELEDIRLKEIRQTAREMEDARQALQQIRQSIFEKVAGFGEAAPAYNECCDRADIYCNVPVEAHEPEEPHDHLEPHAHLEGSVNVAVPPPPVYNEVVS